MIDAENLKGLQAAFKSMQAQIDEIIPNLPMDEDQLLERKNSIFKNTVRLFQEVSMIHKDQGLDTHIEKIANKLEQEYSKLLKENREVIKQMLQDYFENNFKPLVNSNLSQQKYQSFQDYDKEMELFKIEFIRKMEGKANNVELLIDQIFLRYNSLVYKEIASTSKHNSEIEFAATKERLRIAEEDIQRQRIEFLESRSLLESKIKQLEDERVQFSAQNQILSEKISLKDKEILNVSLTWKQKYEEVNEKLVKINERYSTLDEKYQELKDESSQKDTTFIKENSEIMAKRELAENEVRFLREQVNNKEERIEDLQETILNLKEENQQKDIQLKEASVLQEKELGDIRDKEIERYRRDIEHIKKVKENIEVNYQSLQKENIEAINRNTDLNKVHQNMVDEKQQNKKLTKKLLDHLKSKLIEKHESN